MERSNDTRYLLPSVGQYNQVTSHALKSEMNDDSIHPVFVEVGIKFANEKIIGSNARCVALLSAIKKFIKTYEQPATDILKRDLEKKLEKNLIYLRKCRAFHHGMDLAVKHIKQLISVLSPDIQQKVAQDWLIDQINQFVDQKIISADKFIIEYGMKLIKKDDVIMTYGRSYVVENLLLNAYKSGIDFSLIVVDNPPYNEGKEFLNRLSKVGIKAKYTMITGAAYFMKDVNKVFVGASSILTNGNVVSRVGTAMIGCIASNYRVPFHVFCETYKFSEKNLLDSFGISENGNPEKLLPLDIPNKNLKAINPYYDLTPKDYVGMVITELGPIPPTSVPVIIREFMKDAYANIQGPSIINM